jgi:hypothetical protein
MSDPARWGDKQDKILDAMAGKINEIAEEKLTKKPKEMKPAIQEKEGEKAENEEKEESELKPPGGALNVLGLIPNVRLNSPLLHPLWTIFKTLPGLHARLMLIWAGLLGVLAGEPQMDNIAAKANADQYLKYLLRTRFFRISAELANDFKTKKISLGVFSKEEPWPVRFKGRVLGRYTDNAGIVVDIPGSILAIMLAGRPSAEAPLTLRMRYRLAHALFTHMLAYQGWRYRCNATHLSLDLAEKINRIKFLKQSVISGLINQWALRRNPEAYLMHRFYREPDEYKSVLGAMLKNEQGDLRLMMRESRITDINTFQEKMLSALINMLRQQPENILLLEDVIRFMNWVTPGATFKAGSINGRQIRLPEMLRSGTMQGNFGFLWEYLQKFPHAISLDQDKKPVIPRIIRYVGQAA